MEVQLAAESADVGGGGQAAIAAGAGFRADLGVGSVAALRASIISRGYALISASSSVGGWWSALSRSCLRDTLEL